MISTSRQIAEQLLMPSPHDVAIGLHSWRISEVLPGNPEVFKAMANRQFSGQENASIVRIALAIMCSLDPANSRLLYTRWWQAGGDTRQMLSLATLRVPEMENALSRELIEQPTKACSIYQHTVVPLIDELTFSRRTPLPEVEVISGMGIVSRLASLAYARHRRGVGKVSQMAMEALLERSFIVAPSWGWQSGHDLAAVAQAIGLLLEAGATVRKRKVVHIDIDGQQIKTRVPDLVCEALLRASAGPQLERNSEDVVGALASEDKNWIHTWQLSVARHGDWQSRLDQLRRNTPVLMRQRLAQEGCGHHATQAGPRM